MLVQFAHALMLRVANATKINNNFLLSVPCVTTVTYSYVT